MTKSNRLQSLDAFRGLTIAFMILVNTPGSWEYVYPPLRHADWHGCTPTDLVFPFFLFIVGVAMSFSFKRYNNKWQSAAVRKIIKRTLIIFAVGLLLHAFPFYNKQISGLRIMGVLQRIALAYGAGALLVLAFPKPRQLLFVCAGLLLGYWGILVGFGGDQPFDLETNVVRQFDRWLLGDSHLWKGKGLPFDPEGVLSTIPSIAQVILGYLAGRLIQTRRNDPLLVRNMWLIGVGGIALGCLWHLAFPINKSLWTSSFVCYTSGWAMLLLGFFYWLMDKQQIRGWAFPLLVFGSNSIFAYVLASLVTKILLIWKIGEPTRSAYNYIYTEWLTPLAGAQNGSLLFAILMVTFCWVITWLMYKRGIFIKI